MASSKPRRKPPPKPDDAEQSRRFEETARELGADETGKAFEGAFETVVPKTREAEQKKKP